MKLRPSNADGGAIIVAPADRLAVIAPEPEPVLVAAAFWSTNVTSQRRPFQQTNCGTIEFIIAVCGAVVIVSTVLVYGAI